MPQAKTLTSKELKVLLATVAEGRHAARNRLMILMSVWAGMRVGEIASLRIENVVGPNNVVLDQIRLDASQTKGNRGRVIFVGEKLRKEISAYLAALKYKVPSAPLFYSQRGSTGFSANTLCQHFATIYAKAGIDGASSHSGRRTFITSLANKGVGVRVLMALAGHRNMSTTQRYIDINDEMLRVAVDLV